MKKLKLLGSYTPLSTKEDLVKISSLHSITLPPSFVDFMVQYQGGQVKESEYTSQSGKTYSLHQFLYVEKHPVGASIEMILEGNKFYGYEDFFPFAIDPGGWVFNLSLDRKTYDQIWIDKFDSGEENPLEFVSNSFEEFIDGLREEEPE